MNTDPTPASGALIALKDSMPGRFFLPRDTGYDAARGPWNTAVEQFPAAVAVVISVDEVIAVVRAARAAGLRVAPQSTGHNAGPLASKLADAILLRLSEFTGVSVDAPARRAHVVGGTVWDAVVNAAAEHGLAAMHGSSPDVGVIGYTLGGGLSWYARRHGWAADHVLAVDVVTADGELLRADADHHPELLWAVRGGGGGIGVVVGIDIALLPLPDVYGGMLLWDGVHAGEVTHAWARWTATVPDSVTTALRLMSFPPLPELPEFLRGRQLVVVDGTILTGDSEATDLLAPLRDLAPELDTFARVPAAAIARIHLDPEHPTPGVSDHLLIADLPSAAVDAFLGACGPESATTLLSAELRHLGGALRRQPPGCGVLSGLDAAFSAFFVAVAPTPQVGAIGRADAARAVAALMPWAAGQRLLNFTEYPVEPSSGFDPEIWQRLRELRALVDPTGVFVAAHIG